MEEKGGCEGVEKVSLLRIRRLGGSAQTRLPYSFLGSLLITPAAFTFSLDLEMFVGN